MLCIFLEVQTGSHNRILIVGSQNDRQWCYISSHATPCQPFCQNLQDPYGAHGGVWVATRFVGHILDPDLFVAPIEPNFRRVSPKDLESRKRDWAVVPHLGRSLFLDEDQNFNPYHLWVPEFHQVLEVSD